eukprot:CAMPEP_0181291820 /NCGR_PEP_ID=MMETSP1101-20121128/2174_1 /TAXON_ID=46948 /ORGANISM="Rhodomonas abbreviata, Strain Caron Lab Isolate" /LENGTH=228 /DNA_ID=CAMNT_0023396243 /DNA_START=1 /DNA_END=687 /DNA_ORIENTATION=-
MHSAASCLFAGFVAMAMLASSSAFMGSSLMPLASGRTLPVCNRHRGTQPATPRMLFVEAVPEEEVGEGERKVVKLRNLKVVVTMKEGKYYAFNNKCPHLGLSLKRGEITASDDRHGICVTCPYHKSKFSLEEGGKCKVWSESVLGIKGTEGLGNAIGGFVAPMAKSVNPQGEKAAPAAVYECKVEDGMVMVDLPPDLSKYAQTRQYVDYKEYKDLPKDVPRRPVDPRG